jgi:hypothetical protein
MAFIRLSNGQEQALKPKAGAELWKVLNGETEGNEKQQAVAANVKKIYLNWRNAPDSYLDDRAAFLREIIILQFMRDRNGDIVRPDYDDEDVWRIAKHYKLLAGKNATYEAILEAREIFRRKRR